MKKTLQVLNLLEVQGVITRYAIGDALGKPRHRSALRALSFPEKVQIVIQLQKIAAPILKAREKTIHVWQQTYP